MSTINNAAFDVDSDEEQDPDFVPDEQSDSSDEDTAAAAAPSVSENVDKEAERAVQKEARASLWASFQSSVAGSSDASRDNSAAPSRQVKLVKVEKMYRFAGEEVSEVIEVPEDSEEAKRWPLWKPSSSPAAEVTANRTTREVDVENRATASTTNTVYQASGTTTPSTPSANTVESGPSSVSSTPPGPARRRPGPRKPKTTLAPLPSHGKPKKLTTLEKSAMDWRTHVAGAGTQDASGAEGADSIADELERNRRGGGYLEKVAFLERVGDRREELFEDSRKKRRKG